MGMYDEVSNYVAKKIIKDCPMCNKYLYDDEEPVEWQTKSFESLLKVIGVEDIDRDEFEMHTICPHCNRYFSLHVDLLSSLCHIDGKYAGGINLAIPFVDSELTDEYINAKISKTFNKGTKDWLDYNCYEIPYFDEDSDKEHLLSILRDIRDNHYVISKWKLEDLE